MSNYQTGYLPGVAEGGHKHRSRVMVFLALAIILAVILFQNSDIESSSLARENIEHTPSLMVKTVPVLAKEPEKKEEASDSLLELQRIYEKDISIILDH